MRDGRTVPTQAARGPVATADEFLTAQSRYRIEKRIGEGGFGDVYRAVQLGPGGALRRVVLKVLRPGSSDYVERLGRFQKEAEELAALTGHPNVVALYAHHELEGDRHALVLEEAGDLSLAQLLERDRIVPVQRALSIAAQVCLALEAAHERHVLHRDLKPANIMLTEDEPDRVKLIDFGIAKNFLGPDGEGRTIEQRTDQHVAIGTVGYASPEQLAVRTVDARSDLFSLGIVLFEMLTGRKPFPDALDGYRYATSTGQGPMPSSFGAAVPPELDKLVVRLLERKPYDRPDSARAVHKALEKIARRFEPDSGPVPAPVVPRGRAWWPVIVLLPLAVALSGAVIARYWRLPEPVAPVVVEVPKVEAKIPEVPRPRVRLTSRGERITASAPGRPGTETSVAYLPVDGSPIWLQARDARFSITLRASAFDPSRKEAVVRAVVDPNGVAYFEGLPHQPGVPVGELPAVVAFPTTNVQPGVPELEAVMEL